MCIKRVMRLSFRYLLNQRTWLGLLLSDHPFVHHLCKCDWLWSWDHPPILRMRSLKCWFLHFLRGYQKKSSLFGRQDSPAIGKILRPKVISNFRNEAPLDVVVGNLNDRYNKIFRLGVTFSFSITGIALQTWTIDDFDYSPNQIIDTI